MDGEELPGSASIMHDGEAAAVAAAVAVAAGAEPEHEDDVGGEDVGMVAVAEAAEPLPIPAGGEGGKRKRGRPRKNQGQGQERAPAKGKEEEEVCFICFDGGELVVCDRRGCPKVYHPPCVNRDASYFRSRGRWNCGWHICSECGKAAHFMCYTCTYSLCKACSKEGRYVSIRGNKGLCEACFATVMLIESNEHNEAGVNFNDKSSWDYLFKEYWLALKGKLSLTLEELTAAKNAGKRPGVVSHNEDSSDESYDANDDQEGSSDSFSEHYEGRNSSRKKVKRQSRNAAGSRNVSGSRIAAGSRITADVENSVKQVDNEGVPTAEDTKWASQELLEFVAHMKDGDTSLLSQFDVQALLLEYIKKNNLRDPRKKSQIICDLMLQKLFVKERVGHFEMLKLLESHFLIKEASQVLTDDNQGGVVDPYSGHMDDEAYSDAATKISSEKRRKTRRRVEEREPQTNLDGYAAIDVHNINLISLRRSLMEDLIDDIDEFSEKVVGSFVRIRIPATGQKQDLYRLVQIVGTSEAAEIYKIGKKTTNIKLEILNLDKTETITIDAISNQEFTVEECSRLRQSIKCGLINRLTVRQVQEKARALQAVRVNDWLESEKLRLGHLRDRASEKGRRKELRECVEKLQLLNTPEERRRRLNEVPEIHDDPKMDPVYESADEEESYDKNQGNYSRSKESLSLRKGREGLSSGKGGLIPSNNWNSAHKSSNTNWETNKSTVAEGVRDKLDSFGSFGDRTTELSPIQGNDVHHSSLGAANRTGNQHAVIPEQSYGAALENLSASLSTGISVPTTINEAEKIWHYRDPSGKVQGPFSMTQLRKWNTTGYFPPDLRIWQNYEKQDESLLLTDALTGKFQKQWAPQHDHFHQPTTFVIAVDNRENKSEGDWGGNNNPKWLNNNPNIGNWNAGRNDATFSASGNSELPNADRWINQLSAWSAGPTDPTLSSTVNSELANANRWVNQSSAWSAPRTEVPNSMEVKNGSRGWETSRDVSAWSGQPQALSSRGPTATFSGNNYQPRPYQGRGSRGGNAGRWNQGHDSGSSWNSNRPRGSQPSGQSYERQQSSFSFSDQQVSEELRIAQHANVPGNQWRNDPINLASPTPQPVRGIWANGQGGVNLSSVPSTASQHMGSGWGINTSNWSIVTHQSPTGTMEPNKAAAAVSSVGGWGSNSSASNVLKPADKPDGWDSQRDTPIPDKDKKADGWGSNSASTSLKQADKTDGRDSWSPVSTSLPDKAKVAETVDATQILERSDGLGGHLTFGQQKMPFECDALVRFENQSPLPMDGMNPSDSALVSICSITNELSGAVNANRFLQGDCPSPTPLCERLELPVVQCDELDTVSAAPALGKSEPPAHLFPEVVDNLQPVSSVMTEVVVDKGLIINSEAQNSLSPLSVVETKLNSLAASVMPTADSDSAHRSEALSGSKLVSESQGWGSVLDQKGDQDGSRPNPPSGRLEQNQTQTDTNGSQWSLPSPTPSTESSRWEICADSSSGNDQTNPWVSFDSSKPQPSLAKAGSSMEPAEPSSRGWGSGAKDIQNTGWDQRNHLLAQQNPNRGTGTGPGDTNMGWGSWDSPAQTGTNSNTGWGTTAEGSTDANTDGGISAQRSIIANTGWGAPAQGNMNANRGWEAPALGSKNAGTGWGALVPGSTDANTGQGAPSHGSMNPVTGWGAPTHGNAGNPSWGVPAQGNSNPNPGWGSTNQKPNWGGPTQQGNTNANGIWGTVPGNLNSWGAQQKQKQNENEDRYDRGGYGPWNSRMQSGGEGWSSRRGEGQRGICKFHESGYCKKGSNCNYLHT